MLQHFKLPCELVNLLIGSFVCFFCCHKQVTSTYQYLDFPDTYLDIQTVFAIQVLRGLSKELHISRLCKEHCYKKKAAPVGIDILCSIVY